MFQFGMCVCGGGGGCYTSKTKAQYYRHIAGKVFIVNRQIPCVLPVASFLPILILTHKGNKDLGFLLKVCKLVTLYCFCVDSEILSSFQLFPITTCQQANAVLLALKKISIETVFFSAFFPRSGFSLLFLHSLASNQQLIIKMVS